MKRTIVISVLAGIGAALCAGIRADEPTSAPQVFDDPTFQKQFLGTYGFQADIEPGIDVDEQELLRQVLPLFPDDLDAAEQKLLEILAPPPPPKKRSKKKAKHADETSGPSANDKSAVFDFLLGNVYYQKYLQDDASDTSLLERAVPRYRTAILKFPSYLRAHKNLGLILVQLGRLREAIEPLSRVIQLGGDDGLNYGLLGYAYAVTGQYLSAESAYRNAILLQSDVLDWKLGLTQAVMKQGRYAEAATLCDELLSLDPERADYWLLQANAYIGLDRPLKAAENFEIVDRMGEASSATLHTLGDIYVNEQLWDLAARAYAKAARLDPDQPLDRPLRNVEVLARRGALTQADRLLTETDRLFGERLDDEQRRSLLELRARIAIARGEGAEAAPVLEEIVALDPLDGEALMLLGRHYMDDGDPDRAAFYFERAQSLEGFEAEASVRHAQVLVAQSRYGEAVPLLERAQEIEPREEVARYLEQVERIARAQR